VAVKEWKVAPKPQSMSVQAAAAIPLAALTAWQGIFDKGGLKPGQTLLVLGASGGVGSFAVQFAKAKGATVIGTCSSKNVNIVKDLGVDFVIDYTKGKVAEEVLAVAPVVDLVFDCVGGEVTQDGIAVVKNDGLVVSCISFDVDQLCKNAGKAKGMAFQTVPNRDQLQEIGDLIDAGKVKLAGLEIMNLADCARAHDLSESGRTVGKIVLIVS